MKNAFLVLLGLAILLPVTAFGAVPPASGSASYASPKPSGGNLSSSQIPDWLKRKLKPMAIVKKPVVAR